MTQTVNIKPANYWCIYDFAVHRDNGLQGTKLKALMKLIDKKGEPIKTNAKELQGLKALQISPSEFIAIKRTPIKESFYPCQIHTYLLTTLTDSK